MADEKYFSVYHEHPDHIDSKEPFVTPYDDFEFCVVSKNEVIIKFKKQISPDVIKVEKTELSLSDYNKKGGK